MSEATIGDNKDFTYIVVLLAPFLGQSAGSNQW
jgi:hypothetical protein